jgi:hypothetical protein
MAAQGRVGMAALCPVPSLRRNKLCHLQHGGTERRRCLMGGHRPMGWLLPLWWTEVAAMCTFEFLVWQDVPDVSPWQYVVTAVRGGCFWKSGQNKKQLVTLGVGWAWAWLMVRPQVDSVCWTPRGCGGFQSPPLITWVPWCTIA